MDLIRLTLFLVNIIIGCLMIFWGSVILKMSYIIIISIYLLLAVISLKWISAQKIYCEEYLESPLRGTDIASCFTLGIGGMTLLSNPILSILITGFSVYALITILNTLHKMKELK